MSFYDQQTWGAAPPARQPSWDHQAPPSRSGATSASSNEPTAFLAQIEEVDRAIDNLVKSGKFYPGMGGPGPQALQGMPGRRDSMPVLGRQYGEYDSRSGGSSRHHSISEYDGGRSGSSAGLQGYYAGQRFPPRPQPQNDQDQALQAKRRIAAQRERELRNYHQEQQYNKNPGAKSDRSMSPNTLSEDERRDLIARQHRALYGNDSSLYPSDGSGRPSQDARVSMSGNPRGPSPLAFDPFSVQQQSGSDGPVQMPPREQMSHGERRTSTSPTSASRSNFGLDSAPQSAGNTATSPTTSPSIGSGNMPSIASQSGVAPIGTRPVQQSSAAKRATTPNERSTSSASNPTGSDKTPGLGWGTSSGVWGSKNTLGVQASVWG
ncbi:hypothetical protein C1H76_4765 [Elsinoe australis]|uniref:Uncharacterized protein n=1 Tax=Elsinoe australis TaxID=40998 RepID=A0A4U7B2M6_9PEZI|nr:hypothetical protein C1H76_4765 [Elsinoe australis]